MPDFKAPPGADMLGAFFRTVEQLQMPLDPTSVLGETPADKWMGVAGTKVTFVVQPPTHGDSLMHVKRTYVYLLTTYYN